MDRYNYFFRIRDPVLYEKPSAVCCNQTGFSFSTGKYSIQSLAERLNLKKVFVPEHGFFSELQDQSILDKTRRYKILSGKLKFISLYTGNPGELHSVIKKELRDIAVLVIDIQDIGSRYFTYINSIAEIFGVLVSERMDIRVYVIDRPNPAGRQVEGTILTGKYASFIGLEGLPHRHGLTIGEMCIFLKDRLNGSFPLHIVRFRSSAGRDPLEIYPSPNMPSRNSVRLYPGMCLLEGTNISEGRGTTKPFEIFGAPFMKYVFSDKLKMFNKDFRAVMLRPLIFTPVFHKHRGKSCYGCQIHLTGENLHSLYFGLSLVRFLRESSGRSFRFLKGRYEYGSLKPAIEILTGDRLLLDYMNGKTSRRRVMERLHSGENRWIKIASDYLIYKKKLFSLTDQ